MASRTYSIDPIRMRAWRLFVFKERRFYLLLIVLLLLAGTFAPNPSIAMWLGFFFAGYAAIGNDSIQVIGTFLAANEKRPWWALWIFIGAIFIIMTFISWYLYNGDVSFQRLSSKGFEKSPEKFEFLQLASPLILLLLTRLKMPVSTTFMCLSSYSASLDGISNMIVKSMTGYVIAFTVAILIWYLLSNLIRRFMQGEAHPYWIGVQWFSSAMLWSVWIMQDGANIAVSLPRQLSLWEVIAYVSYVFLGLGILFYMRGDKIQQVITQKSSVSDVRGATIIDLTYGTILFLFQFVSKVPMSTTWVFLGLLAGREIAMTLSHHYNTNRHMKFTLRLIRNDVVNALIGLLISITTAILVNEGIQQEIKAALLG
jgi:hypothetical protein